MVRQILYIHSLWLFSLAPVLRVFLEFCIGDLQPVFSYGKLLFIHRKITEKSIISRSALLPCRQLLVSYALHWGNCFSLKFESSCLNGSCLTSTVLHFWLVSCQTLRLLDLFKLSPTSRRNSLSWRKDFDSCKSKSQLMLTTLNEVGEITS